MQANKVVSVHDSVDKSIKKNGQIDVRVVVYVGVEPVEEENGQVVINMQERELTPLFANDNKECIPKVPNLGYVKEPQEVGERRVFNVKVLARHGGVVVSICEKASFQSHIGTEHDLRDIVDELDGIGVHSWDAQFHDGRPYDHKDKISQRNVEGS